jgi:hypothetical protein
VKEDVKSITNGYVTEFGDKDTSPAVSNVVPVKVVFVNAFEAICALLCVNIAKFNSSLAKPVASAWTYKSAVLRYVSGGETNDTRALEDNPCADTSVIFVAALLLLMPLNAMPNVL